MPIATDGLHPDGAEDRSYWVDLMMRIARVPLEAIAVGEVGRRMPAMPDWGAERTDFFHLELLGRTLAGLAPWIEAVDASPHEEQHRNAIAELARSALDRAMDPASPDRANFTKGQQPLVDAAFLAQALLRAPQELWAKSSRITQERIFEAFHATRNIQPHFNNWLLFSAMIEAFFAHHGRWWDRMRVDYALRQHETWYLGNGMFSDGPHFAHDFYNSYVIQPMLLDVTAAIATNPTRTSAEPDIHLQRARSYGSYLEQIISPEGTFPALGRSITYRTGAFQLLAQLALLRFLPPGLPPAQVRCALTAAIQRLMNAPGTFDENGWLTIGFAGQQPALAENYITVASVYLCTTSLLPLGLPPEDPFWTDPFTPWTSLRLFNGEDYTRPSLYA